MDRVKEMREDETPVTGTSRKLLPPPRPVAVRGVTRILESRNRRGRTD